MKLFFTQLLYINVHTQCCILPYHWSLCVCVCMLQASLSLLHQEHPVAGCASTLQKNKSHEKVASKSPSKNKKKLPKTSLARVIRSKNTNNNKKYEIKYPRANLQTQAITDHNIT